LDKFGYRFLEVILIAQIYPVCRGKFFVHFDLRIRFTIEDGYEFLIEFEAEFKFIFADFGFERIGADHEEKRIRALDGAGDHFHPIGSQLDAFPIHPGTNTFVIQRGVQFLNERLILAGVGYEDASVRIFVILWHLLDPDLP